MTYKESLEYIHSLLRFGIKPGLERVSALLSAVGDPQKKCRFIHVAGTNGKGSTCTMLSTAVTCSGKKCGLYTSPYVLDFRERIQVDGEYISKEDLASYTLKVKEIAESIGEEPTEFEFITAVAFMYFAHKGCDVVVLETGLGGRFDATNVIENPIVSVIVPIGLDHTAVLGDTIEQIAFEKAGIIKKGCPVVSAYGQVPEALTVLDSIAQERGCELTVADEGTVNVISEDLDGTVFDYNGETYRVGMMGAHQVQNAATVIAAAKYLEDIITKQGLKKGIEKAFIPARMEIIRRKPLLILDGGHNPHAADMLCINLSKLESKPVAVIGMMEDKDVEKFAQKMAGSFSKIITLSVESNARTMSAENLCDVFSKYNKNTSFAESYADALDNAMADGQGVIVCGSLYLAGDIRQMLFDRIQQ